MQISELARRAGVTTKAVRYYESLGLLTPGRLGNGYRDYDLHDLRLTQEIRALSGLGIPVERTRPFLDRPLAGHRHADECPASLATYRDAIDELTERIEGLTALSGGTGRAPTPGCPPGQPRIPVLEKETT